MRPGGLTPIFQIAAALSPSQPAPNREAAAMGCVMSLRRYRVPFRQHTIYGLPPGVKLEPLYDFLRRVFPVETEEGAEDNDIQLTHKKTVREQLEEEEDRALAGVGQFNELAIEVESEESTRDEDTEILEQEEEWWEDSTDERSEEDSVDRYSYDDNTWHPMCTRKGWLLCPKEKFSFVLELWPKKKASKDCDSLQKFFFKSRAPEDIWTRKEASKLYM